MQLGRNQTFVFFVFAHKQPVDHTRFLPLKKYKGRYDLLKNYISWDRAQFTKQSKCECLLSDSERGDMLVLRLERARHAWPAQGLRPVCAGGGRHTQQKHHGNSCHSVCENQFVVACPYSDISQTISRLQLLLIIHWFTHLCPETTFSSNNNSLSCCEALCSNYSAVK